MTRSLVKSQLPLRVAASARCVSLKVVPKPEESSESFEDRNIRLGREMSPHLTIYRFQLPAVLSITHRGTGLALAAYASALGIGALVCPQDVSSYVTMLEGLQLSATTLTAGKFILAYPMAYHTVNGVRHLIWDTGKFLKMSEVYSTGYAMLGLSVVLAGILAAI